MTEATGILEDYKEIVGRIMELEGDINDLIKRTKKCPVPEIDGRAIAHGYTTFQSARFWLREQASQPAQVKGPDV